MKEGSASYSSLKWLHSKLLKKIMKPWICRKDTNLNNFLAEACNYMKPMHMKNGVGIMEVAACIHAPAELHME